MDLTVLGSCYPYYVSQGAFCPCCLPNWAPRARIVCVEAVLEKNAVLACHCLQISHDPLICTYHT